MLFKSKEQAHWSNHCGKNTQTSTPPAECSRSSKSRCALPSLKPYGDRTKLEPAAGNSGLPGCENNGRSAPDKPEVQQCAGKQFWAELTPTRPIPGLSYRSVSVWLHPAIELEPASTGLETAAEPGCFTRSWKTMPLPPGGIETAEA